MKRSKIKNEFLKNLNFSSNNYFKKKIKGSIKIKINY